MQALARGRAAALHARGRAPLRTVFTSCARARVVPVLRASSSGRRDSARVYAALVSAGPGVLNHMGRSKPSGTRVRRWGGLPARRRLVVLRAPRDAALIPARCDAWRCPLGTSSPPASAHAQRTPPEAAPPARTARRRLQLRGVPLLRRRPFARPLRAALTPPTPAAPAQAEERAVDATASFSSLLDDEDDEYEGEWEEEEVVEVDESLLVRRVCVPAWARMAPHGPCMPRI